MNHSRQHPSHRNSSQAQLLLQDDLTKTKSPVATFLLLLSAHLLNQLSRWVTTVTEVEEKVCKLSKKGLTPSQIGVILRDSHGVASVKSITGSTVVRILKVSGLAPEVPEDLYMLIKKAVQVRKHLERNRKDKDSKFRLILIESRIHRLARYYRTTRKLPANWKYESATASTMVA
ncbi:40S ribosomal protein S13 [Seminavis robusta]|uniref:40S ribosomal protein S13 n=1 Tax=Seminavis robusta TaxID=568900 RepID=A0A9N8E4J4_9STRA|nr:40S ribosomal protein S13 [Seminavis robusta]|eukprot:Sro611_g175300.1 40S ribosomal protein S13 (175) ;mRNA; r:19936-20737